MRVVQVLKQDSGTYTAAGNSGTLAVATIDAVAIDINVSAVGAGNWTFAVQRQGADGVWYTVYTWPVASGVTTISASIGKGMDVNFGIGHYIRITWTPAAPGSSITFSASVTSC